MRETRDKVCYVYGFVGTGQFSSDSDGLNEGFDSQPPLGYGFDASDIPLLLPCKPGISAIVSMVDDEDFSPRCDDVRIGNLARLATKIVKHQSVLDRAMRYGQVLPLPFGKRFESTDGIDAFLSSHIEAIYAFFKEIKGRHEWNVQGYLDTRLCEKCLSKRMRTKKSSFVDLPPIAEALRAEFTRIDLKEAVDDWVGGKCSELFESLRPLAVKSCEGRLLLRDGVSDSCEMVTNWAFLLESSCMDDFRTLVERISADFSSEGLSFHLSGPWPPYSFCPCIDEE